MREEKYQYKGKTYKLNVRRAENALYGFIDEKKVGEISGEVVHNMESDGVNIGRDISEILIELMKDEIHRL